MELAINVRQIDWWFWTITLILILAALLGWIPGYYAVMALSGIQVIYFTWQERSITAFPTQVRIVYFIITLAGFSELLRFPIYILLAIGTVMVALFDRCSIALALKWMPWNRSLTPGASCEVKPGDQ